MEKVLPKVLGMVVTKLVCGHGVFEELDMWSYLDVVGLLSPSGGLLSTTGAWPIEITFEQLSTEGEEEEEEEGDCEEDTLDGDKIEHKGNLTEIRHTWTDVGALGLRIKAVSVVSLDSPDGVYVEGLTDKCEQKVPRGIVGWCISQIECEAVTLDGLQTCGYNEVMKILKTAGRPVSLTFKQRV